MTAPNLSQRFRQLMHPRAFRIDPIPVPSSAVTVLLGRQEQSSVQHSATPEPARDEAAEALVAALSTGIWQARMRMLDPATGRPLAEAKRAFVPVREAWKQLREAGVEVVDHTGEAYDDGLALDVVAMQPIEGCTAEVISETVMPTILWNGKRIQQGLVVVVTPLSSTTDETGQA